MNIMPVTLESHANGHVMCFTVTEPWDIQDFLVPVAQYYDYLESVNFTVHTLYDLRELHSFPSGLFNIRKLIRPNMPRHTGYRVILGVTGLAQSLVKAVFALGRAPNVVFFVSSDEAWTFMRRVIAEELPENQPARVNGHPD